jgi:hypothetical protein
VSESAGAHEQSLNANFPPKYIYMKIFTLFTVMLLTVTVTFAQLNPTLYHMKDLPQNSQLNPAFQPRNGSVYVGFPLLTSWSSSLMLSGENFTVGNAYLNPSYGAIVRGAGDFSAVTSSHELNILNFGFRVKDIYFSFDSKLKLNAEGRIPKDLERLMWYGNGAPETLGKTLSLEGLGVSMLGYGEFSLGFSKEVVKNLFVGAKIKYLQGLANLQFGLGEGSDFTTESSSYNISIGLNPDIYLSGLPITMPQGDFKLNELTDAGGDSYKFDTGNKGVAFDLGGSWDVPEVKGLNVSASVLDLGFISWSGYKVAPLHPEEKITFDGISINGDEDFASELLNSAQEKTIVKSSIARERQWLSPTTYVGASYELAKYLNAGALFGCKFSKYESTPLAGLSLNTQGFMVNASVAYSYYNRNSNLGAGIVIGRKWMQWHVIVDNLLAVNFETAQNVSLRMGLNFLFGKGRAAHTEPLAGGDALNPGADGEPAEPVSAQPDTLKAAPNVAPVVVPAPDTTANLRKHSVQASVKKVKTDSATVKKKNDEAQKTLSREEDLLIRAIRDEIEAGDSIKAKPKRRDLLMRAIRDEVEAGDSVKAKPKSKSKPKP